MAARICPEMKEALRLIMEEGYTAYAAAKATGVTRSNISQNSEYRNFMKGKRNETIVPVRAAKT